MEEFLEINESDKNCNICESVETNPQTQDSQIVKDYFLKDDKNSCIKELADLFGQSEGEMSKEFGVFKAKKLYKKLNYLVLDNSLFYEEVLKRLTIAVKYGFKSVTVLPSILTKTKSVLAGKGVEVRVLIDYPLGEELFKTRLYSLKTAIKKGADCLLVTLPISAIKNGEYKRVLKEIKKMLKVSKKRKFSLVIDFSKLNVNEVKELLLEVVKYGKIESIIPTSGVDGVINFQAVKDLCELSGGKCKVEGFGYVTSSTQIVTALNSGASEILSENCPFIAEDLDAKLNSVK